MAAAVTLPKKVSGKLDAAMTTLVKDFLTHLRAGDLDDDNVLLYIAEDVMKRADATEPQEEKVTKAPSKGESRLPAAPKKKTEKEEEDDDQDEAVNLREDRNYESTVEKLAGAVLKWTGKFVTSGDNEGHARMRVVKAGKNMVPEKTEGKIVSVPVDTLKVTRKRAAAAKSSKPAQVTAQVPSAAMGLILPPFSRNLTVVR